MKILNRYIAITVAGNTLIVMLVLLALFLFTNFVGELADVGKASYGVWEAAQYVVLTLPRIAYQLFPIVALLGSIIGLGALASNSELIVMRAAGISLWQIIAVVMKIGVLLMIMAILVGETLAPAGERHAQNLRFVALSDGTTLRVRDGFWARAGDSFVHIRNISHDGTLNGISIYEFDSQQQLRVLTHAEQALHAGEQWRLRNVSRSVILGNHVTVDQVQEETWVSPLKPDFVDAVAVKPEYLTALGLYNYVGYLQENGLDANRYEQALWKKVISPISTAVMMFLAVPFVFGPLRSVAIGQKIMVGMFLGIGFYLFDQVFGYVGLVYKLPPLVSTTLPTLAFLGLGLVLLKRLR